MCPEILKMRSMLLSQVALGASLGIDLVARLLGSKLRDHRQYPSRSSSVMLIQEIAYPIL